jgi:single-strand DNA-binding protein
MMANLNSVMLIGRLTRDPELRAIPNGAAVCVFRLATNEEWKRPNGEPGKRTCFVDVEAWRRLGEICAEYLKRGREVFVAGKLRFDSWEAKDGTRRSKLKVEARTIQFLGGRRKTDDGAAEAPEPEEPAELETDDEVEAM